ncbi:hypothetical protein ElyMa_005051700 [Elysia marginata]|uniref:Reverse transcriptase zinc-binding domain-containing protein n=1 Tax=Elysia marginata TaxID=1093978 RepID=A0AAV4JEB2_9GAST|nr:hypothetical protein ElyMa_005051700 [Elysia marginata]
MQQRNGGNIGKKNFPTGGSKIKELIQPNLSLFTTPRSEHWVITNRLRTRHAKTAYTMHQWKLKGSPMCQRCSKALDTTDHILLNCPATKLDADEGLVAWINKYNLEV